MFYSIEFQTQKKTPSPSIHQPIASPPSSIFHLTHYSAASDPRYHMTYCSQLVPLPRRPYELQTGALRTCFSSLQSLTDAQMIPLSACQSLMTSLLYGNIRCSRIILYISCCTPRISQFFKILWFCFFLVGNAI